MSQPWLLVDVPFLAWRAFHTTGQLAFDGRPTGVAFGVLRDVVNLQNQHATRRIALAFDLGRCKRLDLYPAYKGKRARPAGSDWESSRDSVRDQIDALRARILPGIGFANVLAADGYEADDLIASAVVCHPGKKFVVVSADSDLHQLLSDRVTVWNPLSGPVTAETFKERWGIEPARWADAKAIAGCPTDNVEGVRGVGPATACKWLRGDLSDSTLVWKRIAGSAARIAANLELVRLPLAGTPKVELRPDSTTPSKWQAVCESMGFKSLRELGI